MAERRFSEVERASAWTFVTDLTDKYAYDPALIDLKPGEITPKHVAGIRRVMLPQARKYWDSVFAKRATSGDEAINGLAIQGVRSGEWRVNWEHPVTDFTVKGELTVDEWGALTTVQRMSAQLHFIGPKGAHYRMLVRKDLRSYLESHGGKWFMRGWHAKGGSSKPVKE